MVTSNSLLSKELVENYVYCICIVFGREREILIIFDNLIKPLQYDKNSSKLLALACWACCTMKFNLA